MAALKFTIEQLAAALGVTATQIKVWAGIPKNVKKDQILTSKQENQVRAEYSKSLKPQPQPQTRTIEPVRPIDRGPSASTTKNAFELGAKVLVSAEGGSYPAEVVRQGQHNQVMVKYATGATEWVYEKNVTLQVVDRGKVVELKAAEEPVTSPKKFTKGMKVKYTYGDKVQVGIVQGIREDGKVQVKVGEKIYAQDPTKLSVINDEPEPEGKKTKGEEGPKKSWLDKTPGEIIKSLLS